jgi:hypothetical protein
LGEPYCPGKGRIAGAPYKFPIDEISDATKEDSNAATGDREIHEVQGGYFVSSGKEQAGNYNAHDES